MPLKKSDPKKDAAKAAAAPEAPKEFTFDPKSVKVSTGWRHGSVNGRRAAAGGQCECQGWEGSIAPPVMLRGAELRMLC